MSIEKDPKKVLKSSLKVLQKSYSVAKKKDDIENMLEKYTKSNKDMWNSSWQPDDLKEEIEKRKIVLDTNYFKYDERIALAKAIVHKYDTNYFFHCRVKNCNEKHCEFIHEKCNNLGCTSQGSRCRWSWKSKIRCSEEGFG
jgi:hypothetical protein